MSDSEIEKFLFSIGISNSILTNLINRQVPQGNLYWDKSTGYITLKYRYLIIPIILDLFHRSSNISTEAIFEKSKMNILEKILHISTQEEYKLISYEDCTELCTNLNEIKINLSQNPEISTFINKFILNYPKYKALRRGNFILFYFTMFFCDQQLDSLKTSILLLSDLLVITCFLDDLEDAKDDRIKGEINIFNELGGGYISLGKGKLIFDESVERINNYLPLFAKSVDKLFYSLTLKFVQNEIN